MKKLNIKAIFVSAVTSLLLIGCGGGGGGGGAEEQPQWSIEDAFDSGVTNVYGTVFCEASAVDVTPVSIAIADGLNNGTLTFSDSESQDVWNGICSADGTLNSYVLQTAINNGLVDVIATGSTPVPYNRLNMAGSFVTVGSENYSWSAIDAVYTSYDKSIALVHSFEVRLTVSGTDGSSEDVVLSINMGKVDDYNSNGTVSLVSGKKLVNKYVSNVDVDFNGACTPDFTPDGDPGRFANISISDPDQAWAAPVLEKMLETHSLCGSKNSAWTAFLNDFTNYSNNASDKTLVVYSTSTGAAIYKPANDFVFDEDDLAVETTVSNMVTRSAYADGDASLGAVVKEFVITDTNSVTNLPVAVTLYVNSVDKP